MKLRFLTLALCLFFSCFLLSVGTSPALAQEENEEPLLDEPLEEGILQDEETADEAEEDEEAGEDREAAREETEEPEEEEEEETAAAAEEEDEPEEEEEEEEEKPLKKELAEKDEDEEELEDRRQIKIAGVIVMNYIFENSPNSFTIKYRFELKGESAADTAVIRGDVDLAAEVDGPLWKFPTGECTLDISIPKVPFELSFRKTGDEKGNLRLVFKKPIQETWASNCSFNDAPGANFNTRGPPEKWMTRAFQKARPPLRSIVVELSDEETTTPLVINKQIIGDPPLGSMEIEGTASITITPGAGE